MIYALLALGAVAGTLLILLSFRRPVYLLALIILTMGLDYIGRIADFITLNGLLKLLFLLVFLLRAMLSGVKIRFPAHLIAFLPFLIFVGFTVIHSDSLTLALLGWGRFFYLWLFALLVANVVRQEADLRLLVYAIALATFVVSGMALVQGLQLVGRGPLAVHAMENARYASVRVTGSFWSPNRMATFLMGLSISVFAVVQSRTLSRRFRSFCLVSLVLALLAIVMSLSRSGWIAVCFAGVLFLFSRAHRKTVVIGGLGALLGILIIMFFSSYGSPLLERLNTFQELRTGTSSRARVHLMFSGLEIFSQGLNWLWGAGYRSFAVQLVEHVHPLMSHDVYYHAGIRDSHNLWFTIIAELGLLGLAAFLYFVKSVYREISLMLRRTAPGLSRLILIAVCVHFSVKLIDFNFNPDPMDNILWFNIGLLGALGNLTHTDARPEAGS